MVIPMVGLVILVVLISKNASNVITEDECKIYNARRRWNCKILCISISICEFHEPKPRIHASSNSDSCACFSLIIKIVRKTQE